VAKYCLQIFLDSGKIQEFDSFREFYDETTGSDATQEQFNQSIGWSSFLDRNRVFIGENENPIGQCLFVMQYVHVLEKSPNTVHERDDGEPHEFYTDEELESASGDHDFTIQSIQHYYKRLFLNVFDLDWKINNSMHLCNLTMPLDEIDKLTSVDDITQVLRSIFYHDTLQTWKRWQLSSSRYHRSQLEARALRSGPLPQLQERYIYYLTNIIPFGHHLFDRYVTREERKGYEANINKLIRAQEMFESGEVSLEVSNPDQIQQVINKVWEQDMQHSIEKDEVEEKDQFGNPNFLLKFNRLKTQVLSEIVGIFGRFVAYDRHQFTRISQNDAISIVNPLSSLHDRFSLFNPNIQKAMFKNNVAHQLRRSKAQRKPAQKSRHSPTQNFYLNPEYKEKVFDVKPRSNYTIKNAVIFEPQVIEQ
jgi:hypothetical protein